MEMVEKRDLEAQAQAALDAARDKSQGGGGAFP